MVYFALMVDLIFAEGVISGRAYVRSFDESATGGKS
jgi:hypothetical protein